ncbi:Glucose-6-phosphate 1-dehydrogenase, partial [Cladochytrium tenue]
MARSRKFAGDLAFKKTYPALFGLFRNDLLPENCQIIGYARSHIELAEFHKRVSSKIKLHSDAEKDLIPKFLAKCTYVSGKYDDPASFENLNNFVSSVELPVSGKKHRVFYMALPPSVFIPASAGLKQNVYTSSGSNRLVVEKPFGKDFDSSKEFANVFFGAVWNRFYIDNVQITFKEKIGTEGRGGYFDEFGIIRD